LNGKTGDSRSSSVMRRPRCATARSMAANFALPAMRFSMAERARYRAVTKAAVAPSVAATKTMAVPFSTPKRAPAASVRIAPGTKATVATA